MNLLQLQQGVSELTLHGPGAAAPFRGAAFTGSGHGPDGLVVDELTLSLEGTPAQIEEALAQLTRLLEAAAAHWNAPGLARGYLHARVGASGAIWRSPLRGGRVALLGAGPDARLGGTQGARVTLERADWWEEAAESALFLASQASSRTQSAVTIRNHWDSGHSNWVQAEAADVTGELPAPLRLEYTSAALGQHGTLYAGQNVSASPYTANLRVEGEAAVQGSGAPVELVSAGGCSSGAYGRISWSGTGPAAIQWAVGWGLLNQTAGGWFLPVARLAVKLAAGEWWGRWRLLYEHAGGTSVLWESRPALLDASSGLQAGEALRLPPWSGATASQNLTLAWEVTAASAGAHALCVDALYYLPLEGWRIYRPALHWASGFEVRDDPFTGSVMGPAGLRAHNAEGPGLAAVPGRLQRWYFLAETSLGDDNPDATALVRLWYRPRKRVL